MLIFRFLSGYSSTGIRNIQYKNIWSLGEIKSPVFTLSREVKAENLVDICMGDIDTEIFHYPHNGKEFSEKYSKQDKELHERIRTCFSGLNIPVGVIVTVDIESLLPVTDRFFFSTSYDKTSNYIAYRCEDGEPGLIYMTCLENLGIDHKYLFPAMLEASRYVAPPINYPTVLGKKLVYNLHLRNNGVTNSPNFYIDNIAFPWNKNYSIPKLFNIEDLEKIAEVKQAEIVRTRNGAKTVDASKTTIPTGLEKEILQSVLDKSSVLFSQLIDYGVEEFITLNPKPTDIITVDLDVQGVARKMAVFEGKLRVVPTTVDFDLEMFMGIDESIILVEDDSTFPRRFEGII
jgi:hypothetical protein